MSKLIDYEAILSENEQWRKLEQEWGKPIDLEGDTEDDIPRIKSVISTTDLKSTFDSSFLFRKARRKVGRQLSKRSIVSLEYNDFISNLKGDPNRESSKEFFYINGQIMSAASIEDVCNTIDDIFKSIDKLSTVTSTVRKKFPKTVIPETVQCSISASDLSFDDTKPDKEESNYSEIEKHLEEAFEQFNSVASMECVEQSLDSVTTLVRKFSSVLNNRSNQCSPRRKRECCDRFKELADFWKNHAFDCDK